MIFLKILFCAVYLLFAITGMTLIKMGGHSGIMIMDIFFPYKMIAGIFCYGISFLLYTVVISKMQLSLVLPVLSALNSCLAVVIGIVVFKEHLAVGQIFGVVIVILGVFIIGSFSGSP